MIFLEMQSLFLCACNGPSGDRRGGDGNRIYSISDSLHVFEQNLLPAAVIEFRSPAVGVAGESLSGFKSASFSRKCVIPVARKE